MNRSSSDSQGMTFPNDTVIQVENAIIEEVNANTESTGYILISLEEGEENNSMYLQEIRVNIGENTFIIDDMGMLLSLYDLDEGMRIDADISSAMTRSIPPQSNAYRIIVLQGEASVSVTTDRVVSVDTNNGFLTTGNPYDTNDQIVFTISDDTEIIGQEDETIPLEAIQPGELVRVEHAMFQTMSIPPQSPAYLVQVI